MKYLVTGGAGFIGSHIVERLVSEGQDVTVLDNLSEGKLENIESVKDKITFIEGDIQDPETVAGATRDVDIILHQAGLRSVPQSLKRPKDYNDVNISGTLNILEASRVNDVRRIVFASSSSVYGDVREFPEKETILPQPLSPYALSKLAGEHYLRMYFDLYGLKTVSLRYFNVFGPRQDPASQYACVIPKFIQAISAGRSPTIYGDGKQSRDFTFVSNIVDGNLLAAQAADAPGQVFNLADGEPVSVNDVAKKINALLGRDVKPAHAEPRKGDVKHTMADPGRARRVLGYHGKISFDEGLKITVDWFR
ncbi:MAG: SDR family oxidoreductase [archaeon]